ncbi:DNA polymerase IV [Paenibacillus chitinolyticus]|uniref:DNA polymerase IV n=1 Tax=Paenibacillus chitinolyticus TaxID=79263 RepID=UPI003557DA09
MTSKTKSIIMLFDMQSFYASVEKAKDPTLTNKPIVVAGDPSRRSGVVLAACPLAKQYGVKNAETLGDALRKCPGLVVIRPHMETYIAVSMQISNILQQYSDLVEPYSIDEIFIDCTNTMHLFANTPEEMAKEIQRKIRIETGVHARAGIGENKTLSKLCCDMIAKKNNDGIFILRKNELYKYIWDMPIRDMWGIGSRMEKHLLRMGIKTIGDLANTPLPRLTKRWGVNGQLIWMTANGMDDSPVTPSTHMSQKVIGNGMTLPRDYCEPWEIEVVLLDITNEVTKRARNKNLMGSVVSVGCMGADWDRPTGFHRQMKMPDPTNVSGDIYSVVKRIFYTHWDRQPVRKLSVSLSDLSDANTYQLSLFDDCEKKRTLDSVMDSIKDKFGELAILRASSVTSAGQAKDRAAKIGGHYR